MMMIRATALANTASRYNTNRVLFSSIARVGEALVFPRERPGLDYRFNWSLNADGVTPTKKSAFRLMAGKDLDLKLAGLQVPKSKKVSEVTGVEE